MALGYPSRHRKLDIETPLDTPGIRTDLRSTHNRCMVSILITPNRPAGKPAVTLDGRPSTRMIEQPLQRPSERGFDYQCYISITNNHLKPS